jgi:diadenosine tetraphosphate (Ap4A) HIT family hydrolase
MKETTKLALFAGFTVLAALVLIYIGIVTPLHIHFAPEWSISQGEFQTWYTYEQPRPDGNSLTIHDINGNTVELHGSFAITQIVK